MLGCGLAPTKMTPLKQSQLKAQSVLASDQQWLSEFNISATLGWMIGSSIGKYIEEFFGFLGFSQFPQFSYPERPFRPPEGVENAPGSGAQLFGPRVSWQTEPPRPRLGLFNFWGPVSWVPRVPRDPRVPWVPRVPWDPRVPGDPRNWTPEIKKS